MQPLAAAARGKDAPEHATDAPVIGSIASQPSELDGDVAAFTAYSLNVREKKPKSVANYEGMLRKVIADEGWRLRSEITFNAFTAYLTKQAWARATRAGYVSCWRTFTAWLHATGRTPADPLQAVQRPMGIKVKGARAATTEEARRLIAYCVSREQDGRSVGFRALQRLMLFVGAMRCDEPRKLRWRNLQLDAPIPFVWWEPAINKNNREESIALAPELVEHLRRYREQMQAQAVAEGRRPPGPDDPVFPIVASPRTWRADVAGAGIAARDYRGKSLSSNGARKWFQTVLERSLNGEVAGTRTMMVDFLMRHDKEVRSHYFDPSLERQFEVLKELPRLWPKFRDDGGLGNGFGCEQPPPNPKSVGEGLDKEPPIRQTSGVASVPESLSSPAAPAQHGRTRSSGKARANRRASAIPRDDSADGAAFGFGAPLRPLSGSKYEADDIADLLECLARVIRRSGCHGRNTTEDNAPGGAA